MANLFDNNHRMNYDEVARRLEYWDQRKTETRARIATTLLIGMLKRERNNLFFEETV